MKSIESIERNRHDGYGPRFETQGPRTWSNLGTRWDHNTWITWYQRNGTKPSLILAMQGLNCSTHARSTGGSYSAGVDKLQMLWVCPKMWWCQIQPNLGVGFARGNRGLGMSPFSWAQPRQLGLNQSKRHVSPPTPGTFATMDGRAPGAVGVVWHIIVNSVLSQTKAVYSNSLLKTTSTCTFALTCAWLHLTWRMPPQLSSGAAVRQP